MKQTRFIPTNDCGLQLREPQEGQQESREIEGRPIVFGVRSVNLTPWSSTRKVYEILEPGCISRELLAKSDVILNLNHNSNVTNVLGRYRNNSDKDTLSLELRGDGVDCRCDLPHTNNANDTLELIKRGDINGMSFAFEDDWEDSENGVSYEKTNEIEDGKEVWVRHVKKITGLYDVAIVTHPAYEQTTVATREASEAIDKAIEEQLKRECRPTDDEIKEMREKIHAIEEESAKRECGDKDDKRDDDPDDLDDKNDDKCETDEEREAREKAEREAEEKAKAEREQRQLEEQEQRFREQRIMRMHNKVRMLANEDEIFNNYNQ
jgi:hypothetical protein